MEPKKPFSETVADKLIEQLKEGTAPWQKPWEPGQPGAFLPTNPTTGKRYRGINAIQLMSQGRSDPRWMTYKQAAAMGAQVRKGEKGTPIQYWKFSDEQIKTDADGKPVLNAQGEPVMQSVKLERPRVFMATVFNAEQIDGLAPLLARQPRDWTAVERAEHILQASGAVIRHGEHNRAFYKLATDSIHMPGKDQFPTADNYYAVALHELGHWSGHALRLDRDLSHPFGSQGYAKEELRAEIASMILGDELGIGHDPGQHAAYVGSWIKALQDDPLEIFRAAADAEKIQDYVLGLAQQLKQQQDQQPDQPLAKAQALPDHPQAFFDSNGMLRDWNTADVMPPDWQGIAKRNDTLFLIGREGGERSFTALHSKTMLDARQEVAAMPSRTPEAIEAIAEHHPNNPHEQTANLAEAVENAVRRDPNSTDEQMSTAQKARKDAQTFAVLNDADMQRRIAQFERERGQQQAQAQIPSQLKAEALVQKIFLQVPFREKDEARALGAKWDRQAQSWYALAGSDAGRFAKWAQDGASPAVNTLKAEPTTEGARQDPQASEERHYLAVPYGERIAAKAAGAQWDKAAKSWYVGEKADMQKLARWKPENLPDQQAPSMTPRDEFADALRSVGCVVSGEHPIMDGQKHRISVEGEKPSQKAGSGFYVGFLDGHPAGYIKNNKTGIDMKWKSKGYTFDPEEKARMAAQAASKVQARQAEQAQAHEAAAQRVARQMLDLVPLKQPTPYMQAKGIEPQAGVLTDREGRTTYIPATDVNGKQWTMQYIQEDGTKRFAKDSHKEGCFHVVGTMAALVQAPALVICEGYATASSVSQSLGFATVCAFDSGNLPAVAKALHEKFPDKPVLIAGDDDRHLELTQGVNPGRAKAQEAAKITGGKAMLPIFAPGENSYPAGLAPVTPEKFREHQRTGSALSEEQLAALDRMKGRTDFNDLATKSVLGRDGIDRQVRSVVHDVIARHTVQIEQQQTQQQPKAVQRIDQHRRRSARMS